jgi:hypothetical protein
MGKNITGSLVHRELNLVVAKKTWKTSEDEEKSINIENTIWQTRGCFQPTCHEWKQQSMEEKVEQLSDLVNNHGYDVLQLALRMKDMGNNELGKDIGDFDLIHSMSQIIDYLLKDKKPSDPE